MRIWIIGVIVLLTVAFFGGERLFSADDNPPLQSVRVQLQWVDQAQFSGFYMADIKGFFREEGLQIEFISGSSQSSFEVLASGKADFATGMLSGALEHYANGVPLRLVFQIVSNSNFALIAWKNPLTSSDTSIVKLCDIGVRPISVWEKDFRLPYLIMFKKNKLPPPPIIPQYQTISLFMKKGVYAYSGTLYNEVNLTRQRGVSDQEVTVLNLRDYGVNIPEDGLYCLDSMVKNNPELANKMSRALKKGWVYAAEHQDETAEQVMRIVDHGKLISNMPQVRFMLQTFSLSVFPKGTHDDTFGKLPKTRYENIVQLLETYGDLKKNPEYEHFVYGAASEDSHQ